MARPETFRVAGREVELIVSNPGSWGRFFVGAKTLFNPAFPTFDGVWVGAATAIAGSDVSVVGFFDPAQRAAGPAID